MFKAYRLFKSTTNTTNNKMITKQKTLATRGLLGAAAVVALSTSASAAVMLAAFDNIGITNGGTETINANSVLTGFSSQLSGFAESRSNRGSNDLTYGVGGGDFTAAPDYTAGDHVMFVNTNNNDATVTLTNGTGFAYLITGLGIDIASNGGADASLDGITAGGVAVTGLSSISHGNVGSGGSDVDYDDLFWDLSVANGGAGITLANGEALTFTLGRSESKATSYDNIAFIGALAVPEPSSTALLGLGGLALILRRRK